MRAVIVYESMFGNTHQIADAIGAGLRPGLDVQVVPVSHADQALLEGADLVVVGGPTHVHGMSRASTRKGAADMANDPQAGVTLEPEALAPGLRDWLSSLGEQHAKAAAFDTRMPGPVVLTGRASKGVSRALRQHGFDVVAEPESFVVGKDNHLRGDEQQRAQAWGTALAAQLG